MTRNTNQFEKSFDSSMGGHVPGHAKSRHLRLAETMAIAIAHSKQQKEIQLRDQVAGIYVANFERVLQFWPSASVFEDFVAENCDWSEHRLMTWERWIYETLHPPRTIGIPFTSRFFIIRRPHTFSFKVFAQTEELKRVFSTAERLSPNKVTAFGQLVPLITPELFLFAVMRTDGIPLSERLIASDVRLNELERVATQQLKSPEKLMF
jgi:hypothetical protein